MATNILGIGIANAIGFRRYLKGKSSGGNISYPGLIAAWSAAGKANDDEDRATLKDLTGNGHDITLNEFAFSEMSGYGGYSTNFVKALFQANTKNESFDLITGNKLHYIKIIAGSGDIWNIIFTSEKIKLKITGSKDKKLQFGSYTDGKWIELSDGINELTVNKNIKYLFKSNVIGECDITIELLPEYPDALVFDGVDDYGVCDTMPTLSDYTFIVERKILDDISTRCMVASYIGSPNSDKGPFWFEYAQTPNSIGTYSFGTKTDILSIINFEKSVSYQTKSKYNGKDLLFTDSLVSGDKIVIGGFYGYRGIDIHMTFYSAYLFDRSLDEQEIKAFIRKYIDPEYLLPFETTPDCYYDFSKGSNDDENPKTIVDQSGNSNNAAAHNFAWSGMSGYGGYVTNFYNTKENTITADIQNNKLNVTNITGNGKFAYTWVHAYPDIINNSYKIQVNGLKDTMNLVYRYYDENRERKEINIPKDGVYQIPSGYGVQGMEIVDYSGFNVSNFIGDCNLIIEMLPEYEGALVFDGVDDYISLDAFDSGFKTVFMVCNPFILDKMIYDQRKNTISPWTFAIYNYHTDKAYFSRSISSSKTYINGILNTKVLCDDLINKKHLFCHKVEELNNTRIPTIGSSSVTENLNSSMAIYKFLGFKEALTEEQIQYVIKKYNLLDEVDEIEVS